jgi:hypothetical protein
MNLGTRKTLVTLALILVARAADAEGRGSPPWQDRFTVRLEALALLQTLNADLLSHDSATLTLDRWCAAHRLPRYVREMNIFVGECSGVRPCFVVIKPGCPP